MKTGTPMQTRSLTPFSGLMRRMAAKMTPNKKAPKKVGRRGRARLTDEQVREMRRLHEDQGVPILRLAVQYGISVQYTYDICHYYTRIRHLP